MNHATTSSFDGEPIVEIFVIMAIFKIPIAHARILTITFIMEPVGCTSIGCWLDGLYSRLWRIEASFNGCSWRNTWYRWFYRALLRFLVLITHATTPMTNSVTLAARAHILFSKYAARSLSLSWLCSYDFFMSAIT